MCKELNLAETIPAEGLYSKGNTVKPLRMAVLVSPCICGKLFWARIRGGTQWVEAVPA